MNFWGVLTCIWIYIYIYIYNINLYIHIYPQKLNLPLITGLLAGVLCKSHLKINLNEGYGRSTAPTLPLRCTSRHTSTLQNQMSPSSKSVKWNVQHVCPKVPHDNRSWRPTPHGCFRKASFWKPASKRTHVLNVSCEFFWGVANIEKQPFRAVVSIWRFWGNHSEHKHLESSEHFLEGSIWNT